MQNLDAVLASVHRTPVEARFAVEAVEGQYFHFDDGSGRQTANGLHMGWLDVTIPYDWNAWNTKENQTMVLQKLGEIIGEYNDKNGTLLTCLYTVMPGTTAEASPVSGTGQLSTMLAHRHAGGQMKWTDSFSNNATMIALYNGYWPPGRTEMPTLLIGTHDHARKWRFARDVHYLVADSWQPSSLPPYPVRESQRFPATMPMKPMM